MFRLRFLVLAGLLTIAQLSAQTPATPRIQANSNRTPAGTMENGILTLHLVLQQADWYPEADTGPSMKVYAFGEEGKAPQVPGPLIRVPERTEVRVTLRNLLPNAAVVYGLHQHPGDAKDVVQVAPGEVRELSFHAGTPGTYQYWARAGGPVVKDRPFREDSQLAGALVIDAPGSVPDDRVFVIGNWRSQAERALSQDVPVINGKSWPYTERLSYNAGEAVRWRWINASDGPHPMHLHGSYYRVDSVGDGERDTQFTPENQAMVVTRGMVAGSTMTTFWVPPAGRWVFHCHILKHFLPESTVAGAMGMPEHSSNHMAGLVLGITVAGKRPPPTSHGELRKLRLLVRQRPAQNGLAPGLGYQLEDSQQKIVSGPSAPGPALILERGRPVAITVVNQLSEPTAVHWHGIELESYYDGVVGWGRRGRKITPAIQPGHSFRVKFTPPRAGTFMYHTHLHDKVQLGAGLYGPIVVQEPGVTFDPATDHILLLSLGGEDALKDPLLMNGNSKPPALHWRAGKTHRIRLINISPANVLACSLLSASGALQWRPVAKDGADLPPNRAVLQDAKQVAFAGETYDFEVQPQAPGSWRLEVVAVNLPLKVVQPIEIQ